MTIDPRRDDPLAEARQPERVDLNRLEAWANHEDHSELTCQDSDRMLLRLAVELRAARDLLVAANRMRDRWAEADGEVRTQLWRDLHTRADEFREAME